MVYNCSVCPASTRDDSATTFSAVRLPSRRLCDDFLGRPPTLPTTLRRLSRPSAYPPDDSATTFSAVRLPSRRLCDDFLGRPPTLPTTLRRLSRPSAYPPDDSATTFSAVRLPSRRLRRRLSRPSAYPPDDSATTFSAVRLPSRRLCDDFLGRPPTLPTTLNVRHPYEQANIWSPPPTSAARRYLSAVERVSRGFRGVVRRSTSPRTRPPPASDVIHSTRRRPQLACPTAVEQSTSDTVLCCLARRCDCCNFIGKTLQRTRSGHRRGSATSAVLRCEPQLQLLSRVAAPAATSSASELTRLQVHQEQQ